MVFPDPSIPSSKITASCGLLGDLGFSSNGDTFNSDDTYVAHNGKGGAGFVFGGCEVGMVASVAINGASTKQLLEEKNISGTGPPHIICGTAGKSR